MSKTTPEEAKVLAEKYGIKLPSTSLMPCPNLVRLAALIDEARGVDAEPVAWVRVDELKSVNGNYAVGVRLNCKRDDYHGFIAPLYTHPAPSQPAAPVELPVVGDAILKFLDELSDDAAVHIWPDDLERCCRSECVVHAYSVRMGGSDGSHTVPLFSREQVEAAIAAGRKAS